MSGHEKASDSQRQGGTGKTTTAAAFICFAQARAAADCDVDAPNLHLVARLPSLEREEDFTGSEKAVIDPERCIACGACLAHCRFGAIRKEPDRYRVLEHACEGCGVCALVCLQRLFPCPRIYPVEHPCIGMGREYFPRPV